jgi:hypothetical protein
MGKILRPEGGWPGDNEKKYENKEEAETDFFDEHLDQSDLATMLLFLAAFRKSNPDSFSWRNVQERRVLLGDAEDKALFTFVNRSTESDWKRHPSFYDAIIAELRKRKLIPERSGDSDN